jgi:hypothetical protein
VKGYENAVGEGGDVLALLLASKAHVAKLSFSQRFADVKICHFPMFFLRLLLLIFGFASSCRAESA